MNSAELSVEDELAALETGALDPARFPHPEHVRLAYEMLARYPFGEAITRFSRGLKLLADGDARPQAGDATADPATGSIHAPVSGLEPGLQYRYWFEAGGSRSDEGLFKTIPVLHATAPVR